MLKLRLSKDASRFIATRQPKHQRQIAIKIQELRIDPQLPDAISMKGKRECRRVDCGEYRIVYRVEDDILYVVTIGKRNDDEVYKKFGRK